MRAFFFIALLCAVYFSACNTGKCRVTSECLAGEYCDFNRGECIEGCTSHQKCSPAARCDPETGRCVPPIRFPTSDAGFSADAQTSTTSDAGSGDGG